MTHGLAVDDPGDLLARGAALRAGGATLRIRDAAAALGVPPPPETERPDAEVDVAGLRQGWAALGHTHEFFLLLRDLRVTRAQAMRLGQPEFTRALRPDAARAVLGHVAAEGLPVMVFVGNRGCVQIHSGPVHRIEVMGPWLNVLDPRFNLHLREDRIATAWLVRKPSVHGDIHAIELYDAAGDCFCQFFGERPPGERERPDWRAFVTALPGVDPC